MAGHEQRHQLVAQLLVGHRRAVLVPGGEQHREHVVALARRRRGARRSARRSARRPPRAARTKRAHGPSRRARAAGTGASRAGRAPSVEDLGQPLAQRVEARARVEAEDGAQDHLERQRLEARVELRAARRAASPPPRARPPRPSAPARRSIFSPWKAGSISLRCSRWAPSSSRITELRPDDRLEDPRALARVEHVRRRREHLA